jgi:hypothetical protein
MDLRTSRADALPPKFDDLVRQARRRRRRADLADRRRAKLEATRRPFDWERDA